MGIAQMRVIASLADLAADLVASHPEAAAKVARGVAQLFRSEASYTEEREAAERHDRVRRGYE